MIINQHSLSVKDPEKKSYIWLVPSIESFDELLLSWNAKRPLRGYYVILSSVSIRNQWSPWLLYAVWGAQYQYSFHDTTSYAPVHSFQDQIEVLDEQKATEFRIRIEACDGAILNHFYTIYVCASLIKSPKPICFPPLQSSPCLFVSGLSQIQLNHPRATSFCSPTSTTAVIHYASANQQLSPLKFAQHVYDAGFDIYGNWSFNVAQAFIELGQKWQCFCARAAGFENV